MLILKGIYCLFVSCFVEFEFGSLNGRVYIFCFIVFILVLFFFIFLIYLGLNIFYLNYIVRWWEILEDVDLKKLEVW